MVMEIACQACAQNAQSRPRSPAGNDYQRKNSIQYDGQHLHDHGGFHDAGSSQRGGHRHHRELKGHARQKPEQKCQAFAEGCLVGGDTAQIGFGKEIAPKRVITAHSAERTRD